jgi:transposase
VYLIWSAHDRSAVRASTARSVGAAGAVDGSSVVGVFADNRSPIGSSTARCASISQTAPSECSTAGRQRLGGISRAGDERLRQLLVLEATAVIKYTKPALST